MSELIINDPGEYDFGWETFDHVEVNATPVTLLRCKVTGGRTLLYFNESGSYVLKQCIFTNTDEIDPEGEYYWQIDSWNHTDILVRDCVFTGSPWGCFNPASYTTLTVVNNLFVLPQTWYVFNCFSTTTVTAINNTFVVGPGFECRSYYNEIFIVSSHDCALILKNNIFSLNSPEMDVIEPAHRNYPTSFDIRTNLIHGSYANWSYSWPPYVMPAPEGNLIKASPRFASQPQDLFKLHGHNAYPNGYFLSKGSAAIDAGENAPKNPPYGHLGTTAVDDTPDDVTKSNTIDLGFHYPQLAVTPIPICFLPIAEMWSPKIQE